jgi:hypothetical protein
MRGDSDPEQGTAMIHPGLLKDYGEGISLLQRYETASENSGYLTGKYSDHRFQQQSGGQIDYGSAAYAQKTMPDEKGRRIWWAWIHEKRTTEPQPTRRMSARSFSTPMCSSVLMIKPARPSGASHSAQPRFSYTPRQPCPCAGGARLLATSGHPGPTLEGSA